MSAAATLPIVVTTLYFTYSRGAWISLGFGLVVAMAYDRRRSMLLAATAAVAPWLAGLVMVAARSHALTHVGSPLQQVRSQGHRLALVLLAVALVLLVVAALLHRLDGGWHPSAIVARVGRICAAAVLVLLVGAVLVFVGSPSTIAHRAYTGFNGRAPAANNPGVDLNKRLFSLSGNSRATLWRIAWNDVRANPVTGSGAGSYERVYLRHRTNGLKVTDAHSLYLEMLAEVGPFGLALLLVALLTPLVVGVGTRSNPMVPVAIGGYAAFVLHAGVDWDWELPAVTLTASHWASLCCSPPSAPVSGCRPEPRRGYRGGRRSARRRAGRPAREPCDLRQHRRRSPRGLGCRAAIGQRRGDLGAMVGAVVGRPRRCPCRNAQPWCPQRLPPRRDARPR